MIAIVDYGVGNLFSLVSSLKAVGYDAVITGEPEKLRQADKIILPGVGAFEDAVAKLRNTGLDAVVMKEAQNGKPLLGICLGMQMLFDKSFENGEFEGLGLISGEIIPMQNTIPAALKIPHIGWNALKFTKPSPLFSYIQDGDCVYFVHSYYAVHCDEAVIATTEYGKDITAAVAYKNIFGC